MKVSGLRYYNPVGEFSADERYQLQLEQAIETLIHSPENGESLELLKNLSTKGEYSFFLQLCLPDKNISYQIDQGKIQEKIIAAVAGGRIVITPAAPGMKAHPDSSGVTVTHSRDKTEIRFQKYGFYPQDVGVYVRSKNTCRCTGSVDLCAGDLILGSFPITPELGLEKNYVIQLGDVPLRSSCRELIPVRELIPSRELNAVVASFVEEDIGCVNLVLSAFLAWEKMRDLSVQESPVQALITALRKQGLATVPLPYINSLQELFPELKLIPVLSEAPICHAVFVQHVLRQFPDKIDSTRFALLYSIALPESASPIFVSPLLFLPEGMSVKSARLQLRGTWIAENPIRYREYGLRGRPNGEDPVCDFAEIEMQWEALSEEKKEGYSHARNPKYSSQDLVKACKDNNPVAALTRLTIGDSEASFDGKMRFACFHLLKQLFGGTFYWGGEEVLWSPEQILQYFQGVLNEEEGAFTYIREEPHCWNPLIELIVCSAELFSTYQMREIYPFLQFLEWLEGLKKVAFTAFLHRALHEGALPIEGELWLQQLETLETRDFILRCERPYEPWESFAPVANGRMLTEFLGEKVQLPQFTSRPLSNEERLDLLATIFFAERRDSCRAVLRSLEGRTWVFIELPSVFGSYLELFECFPLEFIFLASCVSTFVVETVLAGRGKRLTLKPAKNVFGQVADFFMEEENVAGVSQTHLGVPWLGEPLDKDTFLEWLARSCPSGSICKYREDFFVTNSFTEEPQLYVGALRYAPLMQALVECEIGELFPYCSRHIVVGESIAVWNSEKMVWKDQDAFRRHFTSFLYESLGQEESVPEGLQRRLQLLAGGNRMEKQFPLFTLKSFYSPQKEMMVSIVDVVLRLQEIFARTTDYQRAAAVATIYLQSLDYYGATAWKEALLGTLWGGYRLRGERVREDEVRQLMDLKDYFEAVVEPFRVFVKNAFPGASLELTYLNLEDPLMRREGNEIVLNLAAQGFFEKMSSAQELCYIDRKPAGPLAALLLPGETLKLAEEDLAEYNSCIDAAEIPAVFDEDLRRGAAVYLEVAQQQIIG